MTAGTRVVHKRYGHLVGTIVPNTQDPDRVLVKWEDGYTHWEHRDDLRPTPVQPGKVPA